MEFVQANVTFELGRSMESFVPGLKWLNLILTYIYCGLTMFVFFPLSSLSFVGVLGLNL